MPDAKSWRKRRWDIFLREYYSQSDFAERARQCSKDIDQQNGFNRFAHLMMEFNLPVVTYEAAWAFVKDPRMSEKELFKLIEPPISFWNLEQLRQTAEENDPQSKVQSLLHSLRYVRQEYGIPEDKSLEFIFDIVKAIFSIDTVIQVSPLTGKSELKELVMEYSDEINALTHYPIPELSHFFPNTLKDVVRSETVQQMIIKNTILDLKDKGWSYKKIQAQIILLGIEPPDLDVMKQLVYNMRKRRSKK